MCDSSADAEPEAWPGQEPGCAVRRRWRWLAMALAAVLPTVLRKRGVACIGRAFERVAPCWLPRVKRSERMAVPS